MNAHPEPLARLRRICAGHPQRTATSFSELVRFQGETTYPVDSHDNTGQHQPVQLFMEQARPLNLLTHLCSGWQAAAATIGTIATAGKLEFTARKEIIAHAHPDIDALQLESMLAALDIPLHRSVGDAATVRQHTMNSFIGITAADWGVAESATLLHLTAPGRPRSTSLVPSIHIALLPIHRLLLNLEQAYQQLQSTSLPDSLVFITGPSKTADIEAHMVLGAHGPKEMHAILVDLEGKPV